MNVQSIALTTQMMMIWFVSGVVVITWGLKMNKTINLKEHIMKMPQMKVFKLLDLYFNILNKLQLAEKNKEIPFSIGKYSGKEYIKLLKTRMSNEKLEKELYKMIPKTTFSVHMTLTEIAEELQELVGGKLE